ncbi:MAG: right-handed parallel beta-helix repeat-containing protein, partial [Candidatus Bathyarchaeia archaeon]
ISEWESYWDSWVAQLGETLEDIEAWVTAVETYVYGVSNLLRQIHGAIVPVHYPDVYSAYLEGERKVMVLGVNDTSLTNKSVYGLTVTLCNATLYLDNCYVENFRVTGFHSVDSDVVYLNNVSSKNVSFANIFLTRNINEKIYVNTFFEIVNCKVFNLLYINASTTPCVIKIQNNYFLGGGLFLWGEIYGEITNCIFNDSKLILFLPPYRGMSITGCSFRMYNSVNFYCIYLYNCWGGAVSAITISGCVFKPVANGGCIYASEANFITISGCNFLVTPAGASIGIGMYSCNNWAIVGNVFDAAGKTAIRGDSCNANVIVGNSLGGGSININGYGNIIEHNY